MLKCDNCGFGHRTVEELKACRPWSEIAAKGEELRCPGMGGNCELVIGHDLACACNVPADHRWDYNPKAS
jgi:hypothetical protein